MAQARSSLKNLESAARDLATALRLPAPRGGSERDSLCQAARIALESPDFHGVSFGSDQWLLQKEGLRELLNAGLALTQIHTQFDPSLTSGAYEQDLFDVRKTLTSKGSRWWRRFSGEYRRAESRLASVLRPPRPPELARRIQLIDAVIDAQRQLASIQEQEVLGEGLFGARWRGRESDWGALAKLTEWVQNLQDDVGSGEVPAGIIDFLADSPPVANLQPLVEAVEDAARVHTTAANVIRAELEAARKVLLDLGMRNPLLNYRPLRSRGLEVVDELPEQVYRVLVEDGKSMSFAPASEEEMAGLLGQPAEEEAGDGPAARHTDTRLQTALSSQDLQARLLSTYRLANSFIQEQGVNTLFLALGMLTWYESEGSEEAKIAPLLLVPVALERSNVRERFRLRHTGEDPGENLSLREKSRIDFGVTLPDLLDADDLAIGAYFESVEQAIGDLPQWSVDRERIALGFFSFSKFLMYRDLDAANWPDSVNPTEHPIMGALLHDGFDEPPPTIGSDDHLDQLLPPSQVHHVVDADGSQTLALVDVNEGRNLVVQGPPGTGKSQTITNMIAETLGRGRTVLFVSEKMAALEVVKRRLDNVGLGDACLELHSHKTTKKSVLEELQRTLDLGRPILGQVEADLETLTALRDRLNSYCDAVNSPVGDSGVTPYGAYGGLALIQRLTAGVALPKLDIPSIQSWSESEQRRKETIVQELQARLINMGVPQNHPFWGSRRRVMLPADQDRLVGAIPKVQRSLARLMEAAAGLANALGLPQPASRLESEGLCQAARKAIEAPDLAGVDLRPEDWRANREELDALLKAGSELARFHQRYDQVLIPDAWNRDLSELRQMLDTKGRKWWRLLSSEYRQARDLLVSFCHGSVPRGTDAKVQMVDAVLESEGLRSIVGKSSPLGERLLGSRWVGEGSDWEGLSVLAEWVLELCDEVEYGKIPNGIFDFLSRGPVTEDLEALASAIDDAAGEHARNAGEIVDILELDAGKRYGAGPALDGQPFDVQQQTLDSWEERHQEVHDIVSFNIISDTCRSEGLDPIVANAESWPDAVSHLHDAFRHAWFEGILTRALAEREALAGFDGGSHQQIVERFRELDSLALQHNRARLARSHWEGLPRQEGGGQLGILKREFQKRRRHLPIRQLVDRAGNAVQAVKPVFMMSPLSIATYIPPGSLKFDLVIFDEASQVKPVDAFGAILRAGQAVVVGDSQQMPPTRFFDTMAQGSEEDDENVTTDIESVLGLFAAQNAPERMLRWHYRSRHESLIAVSNREYYNNSLVVFPSPDAERREGGLRYHLLPETVYDRGGTRTNIQEAEAVAKAVMEHAVSNPGLTLGVAAFSVAQMGAILDQLELLRRDDPTLEGFFAAHPHEPFFVKNLETVQGDERDVIFISIGYGRDADGRVDMNFGPLNWDGGERRLNVLITRAKLRCEVFTNLTADDIELHRTSSPGLAKLKAFLAYAAAGADGGDSGSGGEQAPPFQRAVGGTLAEMGYQLRHRVGGEGHSVDLAILDPDRSGRYLLGIECDGPTYHSSRWARDRDRLRQEVLDSLGWRMHRIWSTEWFKNPERERHRVAQAVENAKTDTAAKAQRAGPAPFIKRDDAGPMGTTDGEIPEYKLASPKIAIEGREFSTAPEAALALWVAEVVEVESPVRPDEVARRIAEAANVGRGRRFQEVVERSITHAVEAGRVLRRGEFLWWTDMDQPVLRNRSKLPTASRKIGLVAPEEIAVAVRRVVSGAYGIDQSDVSGLVVRLLGFGRVTIEMKARIEPVIRQMVTDGDLEQHGSQLQMAGPEDASGPPPLADSTGLRNPA